MNKREYSDAIAVLAAAFNRQMSDQQHLAFYSVLKDFDVEPFKKAIIVFLSEGDDWPTIAKLRRLTTEQIEGSVRPHGDAFDHIMKQVRSYGYPHKNRLEQILTPDEIQAVNQVGGWIGGRRRRENLPESVKPRLEYMQELMKLAESKRITSEGDQK